MVSVIEKIKNVCLNRHPSYSKLYTIDDLKKKNSKIKNISMKDKKNIKILVIDDQGFDIERLQKLGYLDIKKIQAYESMDQFEHYDIILCDINGVAKELNKVYQGAALASLIKDTYPSKVVVLFSAKPKKADFYKYIQETDDFLLKNVETAELAEKLNLYISWLNDPIGIWEATKKRLFKNGITAKTIGLMEHYYVKSILENKDCTSDILKAGHEVSEELVATILSGAISLVNLYLKVSSGS